MGSVTMTRPLSRALRQLYALEEQWNGILL